jgi:GNAT superfamily N-acetyltransferase
MVYTVQLEHYWQAVISSFGSKSRFKGADVVVYPKVPLCVLNHAANIHTSADNTAALISQVEQHFKANQVPFACFRITPLTQPETFVSDLKAAGYVQEGVNQSVMTFNAAIAPQKNKEVQIQIVRNEDDVDIFNQLMISIFEIPQELENGYADFTKECMQGSWKFYLAYLDGEAVGTCALFCSGGVSGVYDVGTLPKYRGKGIGSALTLQALQDAAAIGCKMHSLQAEEGGNAECLYKKLGFTTDHTIQFFAKQLK